MSASGRWGFIGRSGHEPEPLGWAELSGPGRRAAARADQRGCGQVATPRWAVAAKRVADLCAALRELKEFDTRVESLAELVHDKAALRNLVEPARTRLAISWCPPPTGDSLIAHLDRLLPHALRVGPPLRRHHVRHDGVQVAPARARSVKFSGRSRFQRELARLGPESFEHEVLASGLTEREALDLEAAEIVRLRAEDDGFNTRREHVRLPKL